jgi:SAM-dependent methyltransferase
MLKSHKKTIFETLGRNSVHPFPARMAAGIALDALGESLVPLRVLDPMSGSGTVLAVARAKGHRAFGCDVDPLAVLIARVWTHTVDAEEVREKASEVLDCARRSFASLTTAQAYPVGSDEETRAFVRYWFDPNARCQLTALAMSISRVRRGSVRDALWCAFSRLIISKKAGASRAMDLSHSRPHRYFQRAPIKPFNRFEAAVSTVVENCPRTGSGAVGPVAIVKRGDARKLEIRSGTVDLVLTSPPYLNAIDYMRCSKFSLVWMGFNIEELREIRGESVGAEASREGAADDDWVQSVLGDLKLRPALSGRDYGMLARYVSDMDRAVKEAARVLRPGGRAVYVVGDSTSRGTFIRNSSIVKAVAERHGLKLVARQCRSLPANRRYLPPPKRRKLQDALDARMRKEVVLAFNKPRPAKFQPIAAQ